MSDAPVIAVGCTAALAMVLSAVWPAARKGEDVPAKPVDPMPVRSSPKPVESISMTLTPDPLTGKMQEAFDALEAAYPVLIKVEALKTALKNLVDARYSSPPRDVAAALADLQLALDMPGADAATLKKVYEAISELSGSTSELSKTVDENTPK